MRTPFPLTVLPRVPGLLGLVAALALGPAAAQVPDTTAPARYFPLHPGDVWVYEVHRWDASPFYERRTVDALPGDPSGGLARDGGFAARLTTEQVDADGHRLAPPTTAALRFDPATAALYPVSRVPRPPLDVLLACSLAAPFGSTLDCPCPLTGGPATVTVTGGYGRPVAVGGDVVVTSEKRYDTQGCEVATRFAAGIGVVGYEMRGGWSRLVYARVGGEEFGAVPPWLQAPLAAASAPSAATLSVSPNPTRGGATLTFTLDAPGAVRLAVYDGLGREVARLLDGETEAGWHAAVFDGGGLPAGTYIVRLDAGGVTGSRRLTLLR